MKNVKLLIKIMQKFYLLHFILPVGNFGPIFLTLHEMYLFFYGRFILRRLGIIFAFPFTPVYLGSLLLGRSICRFHIPSRESTFPGLLPFLLFVLFPPMTDCSDHLLTRYLWFHFIQELRAIQSFGFLQECSVCDGTPGLWVLSYYLSIRVFDYILLFFMAERSASCIGTNSACTIVECGHRGHSCTYHTSILRYVCVPLLGRLVLAVV